MSAQQEAAAAASPADDPVFLQGLQAIIGPMQASGASSEEIQSVVERAWEFYSAQRAAAPAPPSSTSTDAEFVPAHPISSDAPSAMTTSGAEQPPYPVSFAELAALISSGAPIPGIRDIPDKLAEGEPSVSSVDVDRVKKPWESAAEGVAIGSD